MNLKPLLAPAALIMALPSANPAADTQLILDASKTGPVISKDIYGQFAEHLGHGIYGGIWVGPDSPIPNTRGYRNDVLEALKRLHVPQIRWPGGCFADEYHWRDGIGPREKRPSMYNSNWGGVVENNAFGTHEFLGFCELIGAEPYVCVNVGSGTVQEAMEWVEYMTSPADSPMANLRHAHGREQPWKIPFIAVGNESWGCGGNMRPEFYADNFRRYNTFIKDYAGNAAHIRRIASGGMGDDLNWTEVMMRLAGDRMDGLTLHYYTFPTGDWDHKGPSTGFGEHEYFATLQRALRLDEWIQRHLAVMDRFDPAHKVELVVDEWGMWTDPTPGTPPGFLIQQNTIRDALLAALSFHIFHAHAERIKIANIAQMVNVLQAMILTDNDRMVLTPTYHAFEMYRFFQDATSLPVRLATPDYAFDKESIPAVSASAARDTAGKVHLALVNVLPNDNATVTCSLLGLHVTRASGRVLTAATIDAHNTFNAPTTVSPQPFTATSVSGDKLTVTLPPKSVVVLDLE